MSAEELLRLPDDGNRYELIAGELVVMSPSRWEHGLIAGQIASLLGAYLLGKNLGRLLVAEPGFILSRDPDTVRVPDVAFVSNERLEQVADPSKFAEVAPDLAVEVISPSDSFSYVEEKARMWLDAGTRMVLLVDPASRTVYVYRGSGRVATLSEQDTLDAAEAVPGWKVPVREFFG
jgi:Uma2 family endonuclease